MAMIDDISIFSKYMQDKYGASIKVARYVYEPITRDTQVVDIWATAVAEYFKCSKDKLFERGRKNNSLEKMWLQYFLTEREMLSPVKIYKMFNAKDHSSIYSNVKSCKGFKDVYPEVHDGIVAIYDRQVKELGLDKQIKII